MVKQKEISLSEEQANFVSQALTGKNILVDACIGSGKTTAIQELCNLLPKEKKILYLTYNKLLKLDARSKIKNKNATVTNYHGLAYLALKRIGVSVGISDLIQAFVKNEPDVAGYDVLIIDEYQDIDLELSQLLEILKQQNNGIQIVAVGDMEQKIYDKTSLDVQSFIKGFLGDFVNLQFTKCFRLSYGHAAMLGRVWKKKIVGVNDSCIVERMSRAEVQEFLSSCVPGDILCLGKRQGNLANLLNELEDNYPNIFNKESVYASIADDDAGSVEPKKTSAIFTTYDSSKGLERPICVLFDFTEDYWEKRIEAPLQEYTILRNIFCVAASRGKERIIFVEDGRALLSEEMLSTPRTKKLKMNDVPISGMFDFKYKEDVEECFNMLETERLECSSTEVISIPSKDGLIDLAPCIGIFQEAQYFKDYSVDADIFMRLLFDREARDLYTDEIKNSTYEKKVLFLTSLETKQNRYITQVDVPFISIEHREQLAKRLSERLNPDEAVQVMCSIGFGANENLETGFYARGAADAVKEGTVYELKFVSELKHEHFLQCACYMVGLGLDKGILWNTRDNFAYSIKIPDRSRFMDAVAKTVTKGLYDKWYPRENQETESFDHFSLKYAKYKGKMKMKKIAVIDTETTWDDRLMSIGIVIADSETFQPLDERYYILTPECKDGGMYSSVLTLYDCRNVEPISRSEATSEIKEWLKAQKVDSLFAYNANFDRKHLPELDKMNWFDIMRIAAYKQYNTAITPADDCYGTGKLKRDFGVEAMLRRLSGDNNYFESHNALHDARDELRIMEILDRPIKDYAIAAIGGANEKKKQLNNAEIQKPKAIEKDLDRTFNMIAGSLSEMGLDGDEDFRQDEMVGAPEAAGMLGVSRYTMYNLINSGVIEGYKQNNRYAVSKKSVEAYIAYKARQERNKNIAIAIISVLALLFFLLFFLKLV